MYPSSDVQFLAHVIKKVVEEVPLKETEKHRIDEIVEYGHSSVPMFGDEKGQVA